MKKILLAVVIIVIALGAGYLGIKAVHHFSRQVAMQTSPKPTAMAKATVAPTSPAATESGMMMEGKEEDITVTASNYKFEPSTLTVHKGDKVKLTFKNSGGFHDFVIDELGVKTDAIQGGNETTVEFTPDKTGTFDYYCSVANHRAMGMQGTITVE